MSESFKLIKNPTPQILQGVPGHEKPLSLNDAVKLLNKYENRIDELEEDNQKYSLGEGQPEPENPRWKLTNCTSEIQDTKNNRFYWLELDGNVEAICDKLNQYEKRLCEKDALLKKTLHVNETLQKALQKEYEEFEEK